MLCLIASALPNALHGQDRVVRAGGDAQQGVMSVPLEIEVWEVTNATPRGRPYLSATVTVHDRNRRVRVCADVRPVNLKWQCGSIATGSSLTIEMKAPPSAGRTAMPDLFSCQTAVPTKVMPGTSAKLTVMRAYNPSASPSSSTSCRW